MLAFIPIALAQGVPIPRKINVCKSFFNFLRQIPCGGAGNETRSSIVGLVARVINFILGISASIALALIVYAGFLLVLAAADPAKVQQARTIIVNSILGLLVILFAFMITSAVKTIVYGIPFGA